ncbi:hypothetical protein K456DRAFT_1072020 [Colletotrichum gloeosporioides 23]|nr:hypothetical protein K456DRAFT_1072020 [Colletotrichum gloeosporioides 23]
MIYLSVATGTDRLPALISHRGQTQNPRRRAKQTRNVGRRSALWACQMDKSFGTKRGRERRGRHTRVPLFISVILSMYSYTRSTTYIPRTHDMQHIQTPKT